MGILSASDLTQRASAQEHVASPFPEDTRRMSWICLGVSAIAAAVFGVIAAQPDLIPPYGNWFLRRQHDLLTAHGHAPLAFMIMAALVGALVALCAVTKGFARGPSWTRLASTVGGAGGALAALPAALVLLGWVVFLAVVLVVGAALAALVVVIIVGVLSDL